MKVKNLMNKNPITVTPEAKFEKIWKIIFDKRISGLPVIDKNKKILGIISEEDIISKLYPTYEDYCYDPRSCRDFERMEANVYKTKKLSAKVIMNKNVYITTENAPIMKAASTMLVYKVSCLPVVKDNTQDKKLSGIVCKRDIFSELFRLNIS